MAQCVRMPATSPRALALLAASGLLLAEARPAQACATCQTGDPTLATMGSEAAFAGRLRFSTTLALRGDRSGLPGVSELKTHEQRLNLSVAYAPNAWLMFSFTLPLVRREVEHPNLAQDRTMGVGDADIRAKFFLFRDRSFGATHIVSTHVGLEFPTSPTLKDSTGAPLLLQAQSGSGSFDPLFGIAYALRANPWSLYAATTLLVPTVGHIDARTGRTLLGTVMGQFQVLSSLGLRAGIETRLDERLQEATGPDPHSGGFVGFASMGLVLSPTDDLVVEGSIQIPAIAALHGSHKESPAFLVGASYDL